MYGITITENGKVTARSGDITYRNIVCRDHMIRKFERDKVFVETDDYIILLDGVVRKPYLIMIFAKLLKGLKKSGTAMEKIQAVSLLCAIKLFYS